MNEPVISRTAISDDARNAADYARWRLALIAGEDAEAGA